MNGIVIDQRLLTPMKGIYQLQDYVHDYNVSVGWWDGDASIEDRVPEKLCLIHSEISEAMEGHRKNLMDDKLPNRPMMEVELADALIRIVDLAGAMKFDLAGAVVEKIKFNQSRPDHKRENRALENGKKY